MIIIYKKIALCILIFCTFFILLFSRANITTSSNTLSLRSKKNVGLDNSIDKKKYNYLPITNKNKSYKIIDFNKPTMISHRGANRIAPENSIPAIDEAGKMGYWGVELDVCSSSDGTLYLLHDGTLDRTTSGKGLITKQTSVQIDKLRIAKGSNISLYHNLKIPRFEDALIECSKYKLVPVFDIKLLSNTKRDMNTFISIIDKHGYERKVLVHSWNYSALKYLRSKSKNIIIMPLVNPQDKFHGYEFVKSFGLTALDCSYATLNKNIVKQAHRDGLKVFCWTIDKRKDFNNVINMGVDYIYTDNIPPNGTSL